MSWLVRLSSLASLGAFLTGCTSLQPVGGVTPEVGSRIAFDVNDAGRVALGGTMGPEIAQVEGKLIERDSSGYLVSVSGIRLLRGGEQAWSGEQVRLRTEYLGSAYLRHVSLGRSIALGAIGLGGFTAIMISQSLLGSGTGNDSTPPDTIITRLGRP